VSEWRPRSLYFAALTNGEDDNFFGPLIAADPVSRHLTLPDRSSTTPVTVDVGVQGLSLTPHAVSVEIGGQPLGQLLLADRDRRSITLTVPESAITDNGFDVVFRASGGTDLMLVDFVRASYRRNAVAVAGQAQFVLEAGQAVSVGGFDPGDSVQVLDVTVPEVPRLISAGPADDAGQVLVAASSAAGRSLLVRSLTQTMAPVFTAANQPSRLHENSNGGDLVVIGSGDLLAAFAPLKKLRESQGWLVTLVDVQDVYDEFSFGTRHPGAIRAFMARARQWATPPRALILLGDATFDPRDFLGKGAMDRVPTKLVDTALMETASDDWFTDLDDDGIADVPVGRLPARTPADAVTMVSKLVDAPLWASAGEAANAVPALFVADSPDTADGYDFPAFSREVSGVIAPPWKTVSFRRGEPGMDAAAFQALLQTRPAFIGYTGHGSQELWAGGLLGADLDAELGVGGPGAFWMDLTCLNGFFQDVYQLSLVEELLLRPGAGAFGAWASSTLTGADGQKVLGRAFVDQLLNRGAMLGEAAVRAKRLVLDSDIRRSWILFGDPTWRPAAFVAAAPAVQGADAGADTGADAAAEPMVRDAGAVDRSDPDPNADAAAVADAAEQPAKGDAGCGCMTVRPGGSRPGDASDDGVALALAIGSVLRRRRRARPV
ncbi:MAG TPA: C25 family cysteine peptidase, partial [Polyangia bacterium]|nr:C25 family cysteine peptidase [Polyangia bacterium]